MQRITIPGVSLETPFLIASSAVGTSVRISKIEMSGSTRTNRNMRVVKRPIVPKNVMKSQVVGEYISHDDGRKSRCRLVTMMTNRSSHIPTLTNIADTKSAAMLRRIFPDVAVPLMAAAIMVSTFGCNNGLILAGARAYYAMARDGLFFRPVGRLNAARVPAWGLALQGVWAAALVLPRTFKDGKYGNLYSDLLDYIIPAALLFYILTIAGLFRLRWARPDAARPYRAWGYPVVPALYIE